VRLIAELWPLIKNEDWALSAGNLGNWPTRLWTSSSIIRRSAARAVRASATIFPPRWRSSRPQADGRLAHQHPAGWRLHVCAGRAVDARASSDPVLTIMNNNRAYHQEVMHLQRMSLWRERRMDRWQIATKIDNPNVSFSKLAESMGVVGIGPIDTPADLGPALKRGIDIVKRGEPVLIDLVMQPR
jgi:benzoylformate decarboxylase/acetolactate synthase-1/2/3 large subunit